MRAGGRDGSDAGRGTGMGAGERERKDRVLCLGVRKGRGGMVEREEGG